MKRHADFSQSAQMASNDGARWTISNPDEPLQVECHLLASRSNFQLPACQVTAVSNERLLEIEWIRIDRCDDALPKARSSWQLHEDLPVGVRPDIGVNLEALDPVRIGVRDYSNSEGGELRRFNPLAQIESERGVAIRIAARERNVLQIVERLRFAAPDRQARTNIPASDLNEYQVRSGTRFVLGALSSSARAPCTARQTTPARSERNHTCRARI